VRVERRQVRVARVVPVAAAAPQVAVVPEPPSAQPRRVTKPTTTATPQTGNGTKVPATTRAPTAAPEAATPLHQTQAQQQAVSAPRVVRRAASA